ncbi:MAG TPA: 1,4-alpha-glucan branching protein GlgB [Magnetospirillaceae bacterium]
MPDHALAAVVRGESDDPFAILGPHQRRKDGPVDIAVLRPGLDWVSIIDEVGQKLADCKLLHPGGLWGASIPNLPSPYRYRLRGSGAGVEFEFHDPYRFPPLLGDIDAYLIGEGTHRELYEHLGAHPCTMEGVEGTSFAVWAPNASRVSVVGSFNDWDGRLLPMRRRIECGVWELFVPGVREDALYKFEIKGQYGQLLPLKADPFAFRAEHPPSTASIVHGTKSHDWHDDAWMKGRGDRISRDAPVSIYEVHLGSWRRIPEDGNRHLSYDELADQLIPYVQDMGFSHVELMPVSEHPLSASWGYQPIGLYAPTSRFGRPDGFARLIDRCHQAGLGVLVDWVPGHFPTDRHGLGWFDGSHLYEHADPRQGFHLDWNTLIYNYGRAEVTNFLLANALFWPSHYHIDGWRVDAVASMLYLDYSRKAGEWIPNRQGGNENLEAISFIRRMNELVYGQNPGIATFAEESTAWPAVSRPTDMGGLGFGYKWNMGWMHDTLSYISRDPVHRRYAHNELTFGLLYAFTENFVLPLSHDEVVHGKGSLLRRMPGDRWQKFANLRAYYGFMFGHPGKKLMFMGGEFAQAQEWNFDRSLDWHLLADPMHEGVRRLMRDLNGAYRTLPALHQLDCESEGFQWVVGNDEQQSVIAFLRKGHDKASPVLVACNFTPVPRDSYRIGVPLPGRWIERINSDATVYGGSGMGNGGAVMSEPIPEHGHAQSLDLTLPPLSTVILERVVD